MFHTFGQAVNAQYGQLAKGELYVVDVDLKPIYLSAFPDGTNPVYKVNTEHDCSCCKNFLRNLGNLVAFVDGQRQTVWQNLGALTSPYDVVAKALHEAVMAAPIVRVFRTKETCYGAEVTRQTTKDGSVIRWNHFWGAVSTRHFSRTPNKDAGDVASAAAVLRRGVKELSPRAVREVLELIDNKLLYRGDEHKRSVLDFQKLQNQYLQTENKDDWVWANAGNYAARFRNTVIGTLVQDLSDGVDLERAVSSFEGKVAPSNYKRPSALITPAMVSKAMDTLNSLGLESALQRRHARLSDVSVNNVLWVNNAAKPHMKSAVESLLMSVAVQKPPTSVKATMPYEDFAKHLLPQATSIELMVEKHHLNNLMTLTTAADPSAANLWQWGNPLAWSYRGDTTDSIKERVKRAGGNTGAPFRVSLAWFNYDDLDLHVYPPRGNRIYFASKQGILDVDMNAGGGQSRTPVENCSWTTVIPGTYVVKVNQFSPRETKDYGFELEVEFRGQVWNYSYNSMVRGTVDSLEITLSGQDQITIKPLHSNILGGGIAQEEWGISTEKWVPVETMMHSPNHWDGENVGHKHVFFLLKDCKNPEGSRGLYNEFLSSKLQEHRKVFELLGSKLRCPASEEQLSGLGFSTTVRNAVTARVTTPSGVQTVSITF